MGINRAKHRASFRRTRIEKFEVGTVLDFFTFRCIRLFFLSSVTHRGLYIYIYPERVRNERSFVPIYRSIISWLALFWENRGDRPLSLHAIYDWFKVLVLFFPLSLCAAPATEKNTETWLLCRRPAHAIPLSLSRSLSFVSFLFLL